MNENIINPGLVQELTADFPHIGDHVSQLTPELYHDGNAYCCLSGPNPMEGIFGCGPTPVEALADWEKSYQKAKDNGKI